jgi:hypothetical protein
MGGGTWTGFGASTTMGGNSAAPMLDAVIGEVLDSGAGQRRQGRAGDAARRRTARCSAAAVAANRRRPCRQIEPMRLADHGVFRDSQAPPDLRRRQPLVP